MINAAMFFFSTIKDSWIAPIIFSILSFLFLLMHLSHSLVGEKFLDRSIEIEEIIKYKLSSEIKAIGDQRKLRDKYSIPIRPTKTILIILYIFGIIYWFLVFLNQVK